MTLLVVPQVHRQYQDWLLAQRPNVPEHRLVMYPHQLLGHARGSDVLFLVGVPKEDVSLRRYVDLSKIVSMCRLWRHNTRSETT